ncbi:TetR/AcrR family transcriptional regulator [Planctomyces sp. SH-PL14]|jgi:TetR/AcrR family transcriptional repressor of nem operon|uniref:TetR/AcrR family transcriptional regulator n=1 Tax=Planctomyces sp. SH-PL14 TaxID=1632864 RepID=UPI00078C76A9|nr:TetR/AcrR family transcriptional regulator [Planctomyces sp. SH-PL14]AMV18724.1 HTH-type transcriptional repressor BepR [Planctomyces sp. SH-PL14]
MRVTKAQAAKNREAILETASKLFRERGVDGVGVAEVAREAGLTHGCLYGQFESKDALVAAVCAHSLARSAERWEQRCAEAPAEPTAAIAAHYLSPSHRDQAGEGCLLAALASDVARHGDAARQALTEGLRPLLAILERYANTGHPDSDRRAALARMAELVGAVVLARAVDDPALSDAFLAAVGPGPVTAGRSARRKSASSN